MINSLYSALVAAVPLGGAEWLRLSVGWLLDFLAAAPPRGFASTHVTSAYPGISSVVAALNLGRAS